MAQVSTLFKVKLLCEPCFTKQITFSQLTPQHPRQWTHCFGQMGGNNANCNMFTLLAYATDPLSEALCL